MEYINIKEALDNIFKDEIIKIIVSNPNSSSKYKKINFERSGNIFYESAYTDKQVFNKSINTLDITMYLEDKVNEFKQINLFSVNYEYMIKVSKKGKIFVSKTKNKSDIKTNTDHNREKNYILKENVDIKPLIDMGVLDKNGKIIKSMHHKFKQINKFLEIINDAISSDNLTSINIVDFGCGKSYLTFVVYYYFKYIKNVDIHMVGLDLKKDVIDNCNKTAQKYGYEGLKFYVGDIKNYEPSTSIDMVITLHACDTATDYALYNAIKWNAKYIFSVPCCQHEINSQIKANNLKIVNRYGLAQERLSSLFTDIIRCNLLEYSGYKVDLVEFVNTEFTPKNLLIRGKLSTIPSNIKKQMLDEVNALLNEYNLSQTLYNLIFNAKK